MTEEDRKKSCNHPLINPRVNPIADILPVKGIPKLVIANEAVAAAWPSLLMLIPGICIIIAFESVIVIPSATVRLTFQNKRST